MKRILLVALAAAIFIPLLLTAQTTHWKQIPIPPLPVFKPQQPKRIELANGMVIFLQEDHELPLIDGTARIRGGSVNEPSNKTGLAGIFGEVWRTGGTKSQTGDQLDDFLEVRAAKVETGGGPDSTSISFSCLKGDLDDVFKAFADGPAKLFSRQKGASKKEVALLEKGTENILRILKQNYSLDYTKKNIGAGGGLGLGISLLSKMNVIRSVDFLNKTMKLSSVIGAGDIIITGEGTYDRQSNIDKATGVVIKEARRQKKKIFLIAGRIERKGKLPKNVVPIQFNRFFSRYL